MTSSNPPASSWTVRAGKPSDVDHYVRLLVENMGESITPRTAAYWKWKHEANPFGASPVLVADDGRRPVGLRAFLRWGLRQGEQSIDAVRAVDTATSREWRGQGIFKTLTLSLVQQETEAQTAFVFNTPNANSRPGYLKMGWEEIGAPTVWIRPMLPFSRPDLEASTICDALSGFDADGFLTRVASSDRCETARSVSYLTWRYDDVPAVRYRAVASVDRNEGAVIVFRERPRGRLRETTICELLVTPGTKGATQGRSLIKHVLRAGRGHYALALASPSTPERKVLLRSGFIPVHGRGPGLIARPLASSQPIPPLREWRLSVGDLELF